MESVDQMSEGIEIRIGRMLKTNNGIIEFDVVPHDVAIDSFQVTIETEHVEEVLEKIQDLEYNNEVYY